MAEPDFQVRPSVMVGDTAEVSLHRGITVLRNEGINPVVTMEFQSVGSGRFCGVREAKALLSKVLPESNREVWAVEEGTSIDAGEVVLTISAPYGSFALYETAICGTISHSTGWATASMECVEAAGGVPVISAGARYVHPGVAGVMEYASMVGGCVSCSTNQGATLSSTAATGTVSPNVVLVVGDLVRTMEAFDKHIPHEVSRVAPVNVFRDETEESLSLAGSLRQRLRGVILETSHVGMAVSPSLVKEVRARLDLADHNHIEIYVRGDLDPQQIREFVHQCAPVNAFEVERYISGAKPHAFHSDIHVVDGKPIAKRGRLPGQTANAKLMQVI